MMKSTYSRPPSSQTRQPAARVMRVGPPAPKSASGRLLPVDVKPGTRQSFTVFGHLDGHRTQQFCLTGIQRRAMRDLPHRAHHTAGITGLEKLDRMQRTSDIGKQPLELRGVRRLGWPPRRLEGTRLGALRKCQLIEHDDDGVSKIERGVPRIAGNRDDAVTPIERLVRKPLVLASEEQGDGFSVAE